MQENFPAQVIVPSGYLESSEAGAFCCWLFGLFLIQCFKYSKSQPQVHLETNYSFSIGRQALAWIKYIVKNFILAVLQMKEKVK